jgi:hypothetical protein
LGYRVDENPLYAVARSLKMMVMVELGKSDGRGCQVVTRCGFERESEAEERVEESERELKD